MNDPIFTSKKIKRGSKTDRRKNSRVLLLLFPFLFLFIAAGVAAVNSPRIKHFLLRHFGTPQAYMTYVEGKYLLAYEKEWGENIKGQYHAVKASLSLNQLVFDLLKQYGVAAKKSFPDTTLFFSYKKNGEDTLFQALGQMGNTPIASLDFLYSAKNQELYISCPQAGSAALALSAAGEDSFSLFFHYLNKLFTIWKSIPANSSDPLFSHSYLDAITEVTKETAPLPVPDSTANALRLNLRLSLDRVLNIEKTQSGHHPTDLLIHAYVDEKGNILGHEFYLLSEEKTLFSLTGLLRPDKREGKSGDLTILFDFGEPITLTLSASQFGYSAREGGLTGKINFSFDCVPSINFQIRFAMEQSLPKLILRAHTRGVTLLTLEFMPTNSLPYFPISPDYSEIYRLQELSSFQKSLDFSKIATEFSAQTGIDPYELAALFSLIFP